MEKRAKKIVKMPTEFIHIRSIPPENRGKFYKRVFWSCVFALIFSANYYTWKLAINNRSEYNKAKANFDRHIEYQKELPIAWNECVRARHQYKDYNDYLEQNNAASDSIQELYREKVLRPAYMLYDSLSMQSMKIFMLLMGQDTAGGVTVALQKYYKAIAYCANEHNIEIIPYYRDKAEENIKFGDMMVSFGWVRPPVTHHDSVSFANINLFNMIKGTIVINRQNHYQGQIK